MLPLLAQVAPASEALASWLSVFFYLGGVLAMLVGVAVGVKRLRAPEQQQALVSPQPLQVQQAYEFVTKPELAALGEKFDTELGRERGARKGIHEDISAIQSDIAAIKTETAGQTRDIGMLKQQINDTNARIDAVPQRTISLLRDTQQLHAR